MNAPKPILLDNACVFAMISESRNVRLLVRLSVMTLVLLFVHVAYVAAYIARPVRTMQTTIAKHSSQIDSIIGSMKFSDSFHAKIMERLSE